MCSTPGAWGKDSCLARRMEVSSHPTFSSWVMLRSFPAPPVPQSFPRVGKNHFSPINTSTSLSFVQFSLPSLQEFKRRLPQVNRQVLISLILGWNTCSQERDESGQNPIRFNFFRSSLILIPLLCSCHSNFISCNKDARLIYRRVIGDRIRSSRQANQSQSKTPE